MIQWAPYFFVRLTVYLIAGILLAIYFPAGEIRPLVYGLGVLTLAYLGLLVLLTTAGKGLRLQTLSGLLAAALTIGFGYTLTHVRTASRHA
jgi:hypothetical protein